MSLGKPEQLVFDCQASHGQDYVTLIEKVWNEYYLY